MELAVAIVTALGGLFAIIKMVMMRRDKEREERRKDADEALSRLNEALKNNDASDLNSGINDINNL